MDVSAPTVAAIGLCVGLGVYLWARLSLLRVTIRAGRRHPNTWMRIRCAMKIGCLGRRRVRVTFAWSAATYQRAQREGDDAWNVACGRSLWRAREGHASARLRWRRNEAGNGIHYAAVVGDDGRRVVPEVSTHSTIAPGDTLMYRIRGPGWPRGPSFRDGGVAPVDVAFSLK